LLSEKQAVESAYSTLLEEHRTLQGNYDDAVAEKEDAISRLGELRRSHENNRHERSDGGLKAEIDRLQTEL
jgi:protein HOOK3